MPLISFTIGGSTSSSASTSVRPSPVDQGLDRAAEVLRVGAVLVDRHADHPRLLAQAADRVDLAVVAEHAEGLHAA